MIRLFSRKISSALNRISLPRPPLIPVYTKLGDQANGYRILIDVCHETRTVFIDHDMCDYDELNDLPRILKVFGCLYPNYTLRK